MHDLHDLMASISYLENIAKERLQKNPSANSERLKLLKTQPIWHLYVSLSLRCQRLS